LRSKGSINVARIAERFGGGGHKNAAGCRIEGEWDEAESQIVAAVIEAVNQAEEESIHLTHGHSVKDMELSLI
jgi:bifunctional oligoribonuclease and PAP phosphatase NrnA